MTDSNRSVSPIAPMPAIAPDTPLPTASVPATAISSYTQYLPSLLQAEPFIGRFLLAFERILNGDQPLGEADLLPDQPGLERYIDRLYTYFIPKSPDTAYPNQETPSDFLPWLASWVAVSLRDDWDETVKREFISKIVPLYSKRGTKVGLVELLKIYTGEEVAIYEFDQPAHYFQVALTLSQRNPTELRRKQQIARALIDQEKPAHTFYSLRVLIPTMRIMNKLKIRVGDRVEEMKQALPLNQIAETEIVDGLILGGDTITGTTFLGSMGLNS